MAYTFSPGDVVKLASDGPDMTVKTLPSAITAGSYICQWFAGKKLEQGSFNEAQLVLVKKKS